MSASSRRMIKIIVLVGYWDALQTQVIAEAVFYPNTITGRQNSLR